jgi:predicted PurR-regulated permease PerM
MFVAMLGGLQAFGALGIILGRVLFATAAAILAVSRNTQSVHAVRADATEQNVV